MVLRRLLAGLARTAPVPAFLVSGLDGEEVAHCLRLDERLSLMNSPRPAMVLIIAGRLNRRLVGPLQQVHDQMAEPRAVVHWPATAGDPLTRMYPQLVSVDAPAASAAFALGRATVEARNALLSGSLASSPPLLPDVEPNPWRGVGPYRQGGTGMTGGVPYGRPMPARAKDRDGLELDQLLVRIGPFLPPLPEGLILEVRLQGDVVQELEPGANPFLEDEDARFDGITFATPGPIELRPFLSSLQQPVSIAELERARARHHLRWLGNTLAAHGLAALGWRVLALASRVHPEDGRAGSNVRRELDDLRRSLERNFTLTWATRGVGALPPDHLAALDGGPVVRAAGIARDERLRDPAYVHLGFEPTVLEGGDSLARGRLRLHEATQSLLLAERAGDSVTTVTGTVEAPTGPLGLERPPSAKLLSLLPELLSGLEWGDAVTTILGLDLDLREAALAPPESAAATGTR